MGNFSEAGRVNVQERLNHAMPAMADVQMGDLLQEVLDAYNDLATKYNAVLAKLDADAGVTDTNYVATGAATNAALKKLNDR